MGSVDSHISAFSGQWSTSDSLSDADFDHHSISHSLSGRGHSHGRQLSLSIDPKLFQPKEKDTARPFGPREKDPEETSVQGADAVQDEGELATAVPLDKAKKATESKAQGKKGKGTGMTAEERKKVSHARKVSGSVQPSARKLR